MRRSKMVSRVWVVLFCSAVFAACGINSQPVPPGAQATVGEDGGATGFGGSDAADGSVPNKGEDGGVTGTPPDGGVIYFDAGDDAGDASDDGGDAGDDAGDGG